MQRFEELHLEDGTVLRDTKPIEKWLYTSPYFWLLECELDNVKIEIKDGILYWKSGTLYWGRWIWGVFESGEFRSGIWEGGIFKNGLFKAKWLNGVFKGGTFKGEKVAGELPPQKIN